MFWLQLLVGETNAEPELRRRRRKTKANVDGFCVPVKIHLFYRFRKKLKCRGFMHQQKSGAFNAPPLDESAGHGKS